MQDDARRSPVRINDERELRVEVFDKEVVKALGEDLESRLTGSLRVEMAAVARDAHDEIRRELVAANVSVKDLRIDGNLLVLFHRWRLAFNSLRRMVGAVLMVYQTGRATACIDDERHLRVEVFEKEVAGTLGENLEPPLTGSLRVKPVPVPRDRLNEVWSELVTAGVFLEDGGIHLH